MTEIVRYTEPTPMPGGTISEVTYKWKLRDPVKWARDPGVQEKYFKTRELNTESTPAEAKMALVLMSNGALLQDCDSMSQTLHLRQASPT